MLLDTNILIDYLRGVEASREWIEGDRRKAISLITWMEIMVGTRDDSESRTLESWLTRFSIIAIDSEVAQTAVKLRREHSIRLPDAIIWASAQVHRLVLVTRNTKDFPPNEPGIHVPYILEK